MDNTQWETRGNETEPRLDLALIADGVVVDRTEPITYRFEPERLLEALDHARRAKLKPERGNA